MNAIKKKTSLYLICCLLYLPYRGLCQVPTISYSSPKIYTVGTAITNLAPTVTGTAAVNGNTDTFAGSGTAGHADGTGTAASFNQPSGSAVDVAGNVYIADAGSNLIRKITPLGQVTTIAGTANVSGFVDGMGISAKFNHPMGLALDAYGNIYVADQNNNAIRKITPQGAVTTLSGNGNASNINGAAASATFNSPSGVAINKAGNIYVADCNNNQIRLINLGNGQVSTFAGSLTAANTNGTGTAARFNHPQGITVDASGNAYVADNLNFEIRKITTGAVVTTLAGSGIQGYIDGAAASAKFNSPMGVTVDKALNVYVADIGSDVIRAISSAGIVSTLAGTGSVGLNNAIGNQALFNNPYTVSADAGGFLYVGDYTNNLVRRVAYGAFTISPALPSGLSFDPTTSTKGTISGDPLAALAATNYTVTAYNSQGSSSTGLTITVNMPAALNLTSSQNYIVTYVPRITGLNTTAAVYAAAPVANQVQTSIQYFDALGRPLQTVLSKASFNKNDVVQPLVYDQLGREATKYLPYANNPAITSDGSYKPDALTQEQNFYNPVTAWASGTAQTLFPSAVTSFEASPLSRQTEQGVPGQSWQTGANTVKTSYGSNSSEVILWVVNSNGNGATGSATYSPNTLFKTTVTDENGNNTITYKDNIGRIVCKKVQSGAATYLTTYYIYDDMDNLRYTIPPLPSSQNGTNPIVIMPSSFTETDNVFMNYLFAYHYDARNRLIEKKVPGKTGWEYTVYNSLDQPVLKQDPNQQSKGIWMVIQYDALGRVVLTGEYASTATRTTLQTMVNGGSTLWESFTNSTTNFGYTHATTPDISSGTGNKVLSVNYYDTYAFLTNTSVNPGSSLYVKPSTAIDSLNQAPHGQAVGGLVNVLGTTNYLFSEIQYDKKGRKNTVLAENYIGGSVAYNKYNSETNQYSFQDLPVKNIRKHFLPGAGIIQVTITNGFTYDQMNRPLLTQQQFSTINSAQTTVTGKNMTLSKVDYN